VNASPAAAAVDAPVAPVPPTAGELRRRRIARRLREYLLLTRLNRPIGTLLLLWPVLWALWIAGDGLPSWRIVLLFAIGTLLTRSAGCVINDFADRDFDPYVKRTRDRPVAARRVSPYEALALFVALMLGALAVVLQLGRATVLMSLAGALLLATYPFLKRFFPAPQLYLGMAFGWGVPMAFMATLGSVPRTGWLVFLLTILWAGIYDTFYAMVDRDDDRHIGVRSTALLFGDLDRTAIAVMMAMMLGGLALLGRSVGLGTPYFVALAVVAALFAWQLWITRRRQREACFRAFLNNNWVGLAVFAGIFAGYAAG
jgi:4-hydroxybenzoate polyprenyltransferase